mgnify:CR=1 FL=1
MKNSINFGTVLTFIVTVIFMCTSNSTLGQNLCGSDICVVQFNASWNLNNSVDYLGKLTECEVMSVNIDEGSYQADYSIVVVPTIIVFNGTEVKRFQANIMMQMEATRQDVQGVVDEIIYSNF